MSELNLSADARRRLWQCYSLLLRLADEAEKNSAADSELWTGHKSAAATGANKLARRDHDNPEAGLRQAESEEQAQQQAPGVPTPLEAAGAAK